MSKTELPAKFSATGKPLPRLYSIEGLRMFQEGTFGSLLQTFGVSGRGSWLDQWFAYKSLFSVWYPDDPHPDRPGWRERYEAGERP